MTDITAYSITDQLGNKCPGGNIRVVNVRGKYPNIARHCQPVKFVLALFIFLSKFSSKPNNSVVQQLK